MLPADFLDALVAASVVVADLVLASLLADLVVVSLVVADLVLADLSVVVLVVGGTKPVVVVVFVPLTTATGAMTVFTEDGASKSTQLGVVTSPG